MSQSYVDAQRSTHTWDICEICIMYTKNPCCSRTLMRNAEPTTVTYFHHLSEIHVPAPLPT